MNTGVGHHFLLHKIFPTQGSNPGLLCYRQILYYLSYREVQPLAVAKSCQHSRKKNKRNLLFLRAPKFTCEGQGKEESILNKYLPGSWSPNLCLVTNDCTCEATKSHAPPATSCMPLAIVMFLPCILVPELGANSMDLEQKRDQSGLERRV